MQRNVPRNDPRIDDLQMDLQGSEGKLAGTQLGWMQLLG